MSSSTVKSNRRAVSRQRVALVRLLLGLLCIPRDVRCCNATSGSCNLRVVEDDCDMTVTHRKHAPQKDDKAGGYRPRHVESTDS